MLRLKKKYLIGFSYWLWWIWVCIAGFGLGYIAAFLLKSIANSLTSEPLQIGFPYFAFPITGIFLGLIQWLVFRKYLSQAKKWILANAVSFSVALLFWILFDASYHIFPTLWHGYPDAIWFPSSVLASLLAWFILRRTYTKAIGWAIVSAIGLMSFFYTMYSVGYDLANYPGYDVIGRFFNIAIIGGVPAGAISGLLLLWLLPRSLSAEPLHGKVSRRSSKNQFAGDRGGVGDDKDFRPLYSVASLSTRSVFARTGSPILLFVGSLFSLALFGPSIPAYYENNGLETTPNEFVQARGLWDARQYSHYRLVAEYSHQMSYCREDVEVRDEMVVNVFDAESCEAFGFLSVSELFDMFERFVGSGATRPPVGNSCEYYYVEAVYDEELGYPHSFQTRGILNISERKQYVSHDSTFSCLLNLPPQYKLIIEFVTVLP